MNSFEVLYMSHEDFQILDSETIDKSPEIFFLNFIFNKEQIQAILITNSFKFVGKIVTITE